MDMAYLRKKDLQNGVLSYRRRKTGQQLFIKWEKCMQEIVDKYDTSQSNYLLPIIKPFGDIDERKQYIYAAHNINRCLKIIGKELGLSVSLTLYVARHAWASIAKSKNVPLSVISEGMGTRLGSHHTHLPCIIGHRSHRQGEQYDIEISMSEGWLSERENLLIREMITVAKLRRIIQSKPKKELKKQVDFHFVLLHRSIVEQISM